jgi:hypothetical protein
MHTKVGISKLASVEQGNSQPSRVYNRGEGRFKHAGRKPYPEIVLNEGNPKKPVGKCPNNIPDAERQQLLDSAIPWPERGEDEEPANLYAVYQGAVYEAMSSDNGSTWHGYPSAGSLSGLLIDKLRKRAEATGCEDGFKEWERRHLKTGARR